MEIFESGRVAVRRMDIALCAILGDGPSSLLPSLLPGAHIQFNANRYVFNATIHQCQWLPVRPEIVPTNSHQRFMLYSKVVLCALNCFMRARASVRVCFA